MNPVWLDTKILVVERWVYNRENLSFGSQTWCTPAVNGSSSHSSSLKTKLCLIIAFKIILQSPITKEVLSFPLIVFLSLLGIAEWFVTSGITDITYRNVFCGLCNNEISWYLNFWPLDIQCDTAVGFEAPILDSNYLPPNQTEKISMYR